MKILQVAPIALPLNPKSIKYGGIERVVLAIGRSFAEKGHDVITAAPADSNLDEDPDHNHGRLLPTLERSQWTGEPSYDDQNAYEAHIRTVIDYAKSNDIDIIHDHTGNLVLTDSFEQQAGRISRLQDTPIIVTPHEFRRFRREKPPAFPNIIFTALSEYQRDVFSRYINIREVINNGVFVDEYPFQAEKQDYLFSIGSIERDKGQDLAVRVALETGIPLKIAGPIAERNFHELEIGQHLRDGMVEYLGPLSDEAKKVVYRDAKAVLAPIRIGDCFSLVRIEPLACGTPCITLDTGSAQEAITDGKTGFVVPYHPGREGIAVEEMKRAIENIDQINPHDCRAEAERRFSWLNIADRYLSVYQKALSGKS